jgi:hypothetical protein
MNWNPAHYVVEPAGRYAVPARMDNEDPIVELIAGRRQGLERTGGRIAGLIQERARLRDESLESIEDNRLTVCNLIHAHYRPGRPATDNPLYTRLRLEELRLDRDRRHELVSWWRDTIDVAKELGSLVEKIEQARRNEELIRGNGP